MRFRAWLIRLLGVKRCGAYGPPAPTLARAVVDAAYDWRYAWASGDHVALVEAETALAEAVDVWDIERPHHAQGGPIDDS